MKNTKVLHVLNECYQYSCKIIASPALYRNINFKMYRNIASLLCEKNPHEIYCLSEAIKAFPVKSHEQYFFLMGKIITILEILMEIYKTNFNKKIFISHATKNEKIIKSFVEKILRLGCSLSEDTIFCTSIEGMNIRTGEDLRLHIKNSIQHCDYIFLMISEEYKSSTTCLNEMGAAWSLNKQVKPFLFPPLDYKTIWLSEVLKNSCINDSAVLDSLRDELIVQYELERGTTAAWNQHKGEFIDFFNSEHGKG